MTERTVNLKDVIKFFKDHPTLVLDDDIKGEHYDKKEIKATLKALKDNGELCFMDNSNVSMVVVTSKKLALLCMSLFGSHIFLKNDDLEPNLVPSLNYSQDKHEHKRNDWCKSKYSGEFLQVVLQMAKHGNVFFEMKKDYPLKVTVEDTGLSIVIAPMVDY